MDNRKVSTLRCSDCTGQFFVDPETARDADGCSCPYCGAGPKAQSLGGTVAL